MGGSGPSRSRFAALDQALQNAPIVAKTHGAHE
jgi:hypothetical protein